MSVTQAIRPRVKTSRESILFGHDFTKLLQSGETFASCSVSVTASGLTFGSPIVNTSTFVNDDGAIVAIGQGIQCRISGGADATDYTYTIQGVTSLSNTREMVCTIQVRDS